MRVKTLILFSLGLFNMAFSQDNGCDGNRYLQDLFSDITVQTDIQFGENVTVGGSTKQLLMDVYMPNEDFAGDNLARPLVILGFGGAFISGQRQDLEVLCRAYAAKGFVAATIDYRLADRISFDSTFIYEVVFKATVDMKAAVRFFKEDAANANQYGIDPNQVFVGGASAGAIAAAHLAYLDTTDQMPDFLKTIIDDNGGIEGNSSDNLSYSSKVAGVLNFSGALKDADWIDATNVPIFSAHDDGDTVVPFEAGPGTGGIYLEGSNAMKKVADAVGVRNQILVIENSAGHVSYFTDRLEELGQSVLDESAVFVESIVCNTTTPTYSIPENLSLSISPNPTNNQVTIDLGGARDVFQARLYDANGRLVKQFNQITHNSQLSLGAYSTGAYYFQLLFGDQQFPVLTRKVILK